MSTVQGKYTESFNKTEVTANLAFPAMLKGYVKKTKKWYHFIMVLWAYYVITYVIWVISFDETSNQFLWTVA